MPLPHRSDDPVGHYAYKLGEAEQEIKQLREGLRAAVLAEREACAQVAENACLVPPDGGSPTEAEAEMCRNAAQFIRARSNPPLTL
jgi:hypothetical protein